LQNSQILSKAFEPGHIVYVVFVGDGTIQHMTKHMAKKVCQFQLQPNTTVLCVHQTMMGCQSFPGTLRLVASYLKVVVDMRKVQCLTFRRLQAAARNNHINEESTSAVPVHHSTTIFDEPYKMPIQGLSLVLSNCIPTWPRILILGGSGQQDLLPLEYWSYGQDPCDNDDDDDDEVSSWSDEQDSSDTDADRHVPYLI
jgi:hypothetical protein